MTDTELMDGFAAGTLAPGAFDHRAHVRLAWLYLARFGAAEAERRLLRGLREVAVRAGAPAKFDAALTRAWLRCVDQARQAHPHCSSFEELLAATPHLLDRSAVAVGGLTL